MGFLPPCTRFAHKWGVTPQAQGPRLNDTKGIGIEVVSLATQDDIKDIVKSPEMPDKLPSKNMTAEDDSGT